jgi:hypothetical protein
LGEENRQRQHGLAAIDLMNMKTEFVESRGSRVEWLRVMIAAGLLVGGIAPAFGQGQGVAVRREEVPGLVAASAAQVVADALLGGTNSFVGNAAGATNLNASELRTGTIPPARIPLGWKIYNVLDYGADPTGTTTGNETNIQAAIDAACTAGGRAVVYAPPGLYKISNQIGKPGYTTEGREATLSIWTNNVYLAGGGLDQTVFLWGNHGPPSVGGTFHNGISANQVTNIGVFDITFDGGYTGGATNVGDMTQWYDSSFLYWIRCAFRNIFVGEGADADGGNHLLVSGCIFENNGSGGVSFNGPEYLGTGGDGDWILVEKSLFINNGTRAVGDAKDIVGIKAGGPLSSTFIRDCRFFEMGFIKTAGLRTLVTGCEFNSIGANKTNLHTASGQLSVINCDFNSTNTGGTFIFADAGTVEIRGSTFRGKPALWQVGRQSTILANNIFPEYARSEPSLRIYGESGNHTYNGNVFLLGANDAIRVYDKLTNSLFVGNNFASCSFTFDNTYDHSSSNNVFSANQFGVNLSFYRTRYSTVVGNIVRGNLEISTGSAGNRFLGNTLNTINFSSAQPTWFENNIIRGAISGATGIAASYWKNNRNDALAVLNSAVITANYTTTALDANRVMRFNGNLVTNTMPSAVTMNLDQLFTMVNMHSTALEITNATGAQTFDGSLRFSLPQYGSRTIVSDGANWRTVSSHTP